MSNFLSSLYIANAPTSNVDVNLVGKTLQTMQGAYDTNKSIIDQTLQAYNTKLRGLRDSDNQYIQAKLSEVTSAINEFSKKNGNLAYSYNKDAILKAATSILDDPIVQDAVTSAQNYSNLDAQYQAMLKKDPSKASKINYQDALDLGGFTDYMQGKTKTLGKMEYTPYTDVQKDLNERVSKWAKDNGYRTMVNSVNKGLYFENTKGTYLTKDEILTFINVNVDPVMANQMNINARQSFGKMSDQNFAVLAKKRYEKELVEETSTLAEQKAKLKTSSGENAETITNNISFLEQNIADKSEKIKANVYDRNSQYEFYKKDLYNGLADAYDKAEITDIDYDKTPLDIAKFGFEQEKFKTETALKEREIQLKEYERDSKNSKGELLGAGTAIPVIPEEGAKEKPAEDLLRDDYVRTESELKNVLQLEDPEYKKLRSTDERNKYVRQLMKDGGTINPNAQSPLTTNIATAIISHKNNYKVYNQYVNGVTSNIEPLVEEQYNDMAKARGLNLNNLSSSMPFTATLLKSNKSFDKLQPVEKELVRYERVINQLQFDDNLSDGERKAMNTYLTQIKKRNVTNSFFTNNVKLLGTPEEIGGATKNFLSNVVYGTAIKGVKNVLDLGADYIKGGYDVVTGGDAKANWQKSRAVEIQDWRDITSNWKTFKKSLLDSGIPFQDTNITEVDARGDSASGRDMALALRSSLSAPLKTITQSVDAYRPNIQEKQTFSFSTEDKSQQPIANLIGQVIQRHTQDVPLTTQNNYNLEYFADKKEFKISYINADKEVNTAVINENLMPTAVRNMYGTSAGNWATDVKNPNATLPSVTMSIPKTHEDAWKMIANLSTISNDGFTASEQENFRSTIAMTPEEKIAVVARIYPKLASSPKAIEQLTTLLNTKIDVQSKKYGDQGFKVFPVLGGRALDTQADNLAVLIPEYSPANYLRLQINIADKTYNKKIEEIITLNNLR